MRSSNVWKVSLLMLVLLLVSCAGVRNPPEATQLIILSTVTSTNLPTTIQSTATETFTPVPTATLTASPTVILPTSLPAATPEQVRVYYPPNNALVKAIVEAMLQATIRSDCHFFVKEDGSSLFTYYQTTPYGEINTYEVVWEEEDGYACGAIDLAVARNPDVAYARWHDYHDVPDQILFDNFGQGGSAKRVRDACPDSWGYCRAVVEWVGGQIEIWVVTYRRPGSDAAVNTVLDRDAYFNSLMKYLSDRGVVQP